ncbi:MAG: hypothetical protein MUC50_05100, partial [Myxococcota bacterium]|nr:hypothetical protein [Myxococcota bacterium]
MKRVKAEFNSHLDKEKGKYLKEIYLGRIWLVGFALLWCLGCEVGEFEGSGSIDAGQNDLGDDGEGQG